MSACKGLHAAGHGDLNSSGTFSSDVTLNPAMKLPGNILVVENPNGDYNYGAYTIYSDAYNSKYFAVGKSASHVFNIVNENKNSSNKTHSVKADDGWRSAGSKQDM